MNPATAPNDVTVWMSHAEYEQLDPSASRYAQKMENERKRTLGDQYKASRQFPCPGVFRLEGPQAGTVRLYCCDECGEEMGVPVAMLGDKAAVAWLVERSGLPTRHVGTELEQDEGNRDARVALKTWAEGWAQGQLTLPPMLCGAVGRGKTQLLVSAAIALMTDTGKPVKYWSLADLLAAERQTFNTGDPSPVEAAKQLSVLILDDIGAERDTEFAIDTLGQIIDARYRDGLPTIGATNVMPKEWADTFGDRTASRLMEATLPVLVTGDDRRIR